MTNIQDERAVQALEQIAKELKGMNDRNERLDEQQKPSSPEADVDNMNSPRDVDALQKRIGQNARKQREQRRGERVEE